MTVKKGVKPAIAAYMAFIMFGALISIINSNFIILSKHFSRDLGEISYMLSAMALGRLSTIVISGIAADSIGRKKIIILSVVFVSVFYIFIPLTDVFALGLLLSVLAGMGHGMVDSTATALVFDCFPEKPDFPVGLIQAFFCLGRFSTPIVTGALMDRGIYFGWLFWGLAAAGVVTILWVLAVRFPEYAAKDGEKTRRTTFKTKPEPVREGAIIALTVLFYSIATTTLTTWAGTYSIEIVGLKEIQSIKILSYYNIGCMLGTVIIARLLSKLHPTDFLVINTVGLFMAMLFYAFFGTSALAAPVFIVAGFFAGINYSLVLSVVDEMFPEKKATASGATMGMSALGAVVTPAITSVLYANLGVAATFTFMFGAFILLIGFAILFRRRYHTLRGDAFANE